MRQPVPSTKQENRRGLRQAAVHRLLKDYEEEGGRGITAAVVAAAAACGYHPSTIWRDLAAGAAREYSRTAKLILNEEHKVLLAQYHGKIAPWSRAMRKHYPELAHFHYQTFWRAV